MFFTNTELSLELLGVFKLKRTATSQKSVSERNYDSLSIRLSGAGHFKTDTANLSVKRGDVLYIPKNAMYTQKTDGETIIAIHFINYTFDKNSKTRAISVSDIGKLEKIYTDMYDIWKEKKQGYRYKCTALLYELLYFLNVSECDRFEGDFLTDRLTERAIDYIHRNYRNEAIEISYLAKLSSVSDAYFRKYFKGVYGVSPKQYIIDLRLEWASQLLQSQLYTISEVAEKSGFNDSKYFARLFTKHFGVSPRQYQKIPPESHFK